MSTLYNLLLLCLPFTLIYLHALPKRFIALDKMQVCIYASFLAIKEKILPAATFTLEELYQNLFSSHFILSC